MSLAVTAVPPFAYDAAIGSYDDGTDHWIGRGIKLAVTRQLEGALHVFVQFFQN